MNLEFKDHVWKAGFRPLLTAEGFEDRLRSKFGLTAKYESARLAIGRSLAETTAPAPVRVSAEERGKAIAGEHLFGDDIDLWMSAIIIDGQLGVGASVDDFRSLVEAHWARGSELLQQELEDCSGDDIRLITRLAELLPVGTGGRSGTSPLPTGAAGEISLKVGAVSRTYPGGQSVSFSINGPGTAPHIALMGKNGSGKTTTGVQIAAQIVKEAGIPLLFIDPKSEFTPGGPGVAALAGVADLTSVNVGVEAIPLDFLPDPSVGNASIAQAAMQFRDSLALCCGHPGDIQQDLLRSAVEKVIRHERPRDLGAVREWYKQELQTAGKKHDSIASRLNELTQLKVFTPGMHPSEFFARSWVLSLGALGTDELKKLAVLLVLDALRNFVLTQAESPVTDGFRALRHLLVMDEARRILMNKKYQSLVDLLRQGRSKGEVVMLLSQDPSDFDGQADDFTTQLGTVVAFACGQSERGLRSLQGAFGRRLQPSEFTDTHLPTGVAFTKLPGRPPERITCWAVPQED